MAKECYHLYWHDALPVVGEVLKGQEQILPLPDNGKENCLISRPTKIPHVLERHSGDNILKLVGEKMWNSVPFST